MSKIILLIFAVVVALPLFPIGAVAEGGLIMHPGSTTSCRLTPNRVCYYEFDSGETTTTADSDPYPVTSCSVISYSFDGDGTATLLFEEYRDGAGNGATIFTRDMDNDGDVDATDKTTTFDGSATRNEIRGLEVSKPYHGIDVQTVPASGTVYVTIKCHP